MTTSKVLDKRGKVRVAEVRTPNEAFNGVRSHIKFSDGRAQLPEPRDEDYNDDTIYAEDRASWEQLVGSFKKRGYFVRYFSVDVGDDDPTEA